MSVFEDNMPDMSDKAVERLAREFHDCDELSDTLRALSARVAKLGKERDALAEEIKRAKAEERERCAKVAYESGLTCQEFRMNALSSQWPEEAARHLAAENQAFAIAAALLAMED